MGAERYTDGAERYTDGAERNYAKADRSKRPALGGPWRDAIPMARRYADGWSHRASCGLPLVLSSIL